MRYFISRIIIYAIKYKWAVVLIVALISSLVVYVKVVKVSVSINDVRVCSECTPVAEWYPEDSWGHEFGVDQSEISQIHKEDKRLKLVDIECIAFNNSLFRTYEDVGLSFDNSKFVSKYIVGRCLSNGGIVPISIKPRASEKLVATLLVDAGMRTDNEILEDLRNTKIVITHKKVLLSNTVYLYKNN